MDGFLRHTKNALKHLSEYQTIHVAIGNEACDLDSTVCALVYAFFLNQTSQDKTTLFLPVLNITRKEYQLRTETIFLLEKHGITSDLLTFQTDVNLDELHNENKLKLTLLDHHVLPSHLSHYNDVIVAILDHRPQERDITNCECIIEPVGSCATLVAEKILRNPDFSLDLLSTTLLCGAILTDTINFSPEAGRTTDKDVEIVTQLRKLLPELDTNLLYDEIHTAKFDLSQLTAMELLEKDLKVLSGQGLTIAMSSVTMDMKDLLQKENMMDSLSEFSKSKCANVVIIMTLVMSPDGLPQRQLALYSSSRIYRCQIADVLQASHEPHLQLEEMDVGFENIVFFNQQNAQASRKQVIPILKAFLSGEKTPDDGSRLPIDQLKSTNEWDFTALGAFTSDPPDSGKGESVKDKFDESIENEFDPFSPVERNMSNSSSNERVLSPEKVKEKFVESVENQFDPFSPIERNKSNSFSDEPIFSHENVKGKFLENQFDPFSPDESNMSNSSSIEPISPQTIKDTFDPFNTVESNMSNSSSIEPISPQTIKDTFDPFNTVESSMSNLSSNEPVADSEKNIAQFDSLLLDIQGKSADNDEKNQMDFIPSVFAPFSAGPYDDKTTVNKTVNVLSVGEDADNSAQNESVDSLINIDDTFEFTDSELQQEHVGFYLSSDSPMEVSSEANSGPGSKVSSYPVTPPNSYLEGGFERQEMDHSLPSFNSSEMVERLRAKQALLDDAGALFVNAVEEDDDDVTYTPQNSYIESQIQMAKESALLTLDTTDMIQRVNEKRNSLDNFDAFKIEGENSQANDFRTDEFFFEKSDASEMEGENTQGNNFGTEEITIVKLDASETDAENTKGSIDFGTEENTLEKMDAVLEGKNKLDTIGVFPMTPHNSFIVGSGLNKFVEETLLFGAKSESDKIPEKPANIFQLDENENQSSSNIGGSPSFVPHPPQNSRTESWSHPDDRQTDLQKVIHKLSEVELSVDGDVKTFEDDTDDAGASQTVEMSSDVSVSVPDSSVMTATKKISQGVIDDDAETLHLLKPVKNCSENVVVDQIANQMVEDSLIDINSENDQIKNCLQPLKSLENVVVDQIANQMVEDSLIDINSENDEIKNSSHPLKNCSENVVVDQIANQMFEDSLIDIYSGNNESSVENVLVKEIAKEMSEDLLVDVYSVNNEVSTCGLRPLNNTSQNVIANQIAQEMIDDEMATKSDSSLVTLENVVVNEIAQEMMNDQNVTKSDNFAVCSENVKNNSEQITEDRNNLSEEVTSKSTDSFVADVESRENITEGDEKNDFSDEKQICQNNTDFDAKVGNSNVHPATNLKSEGDNSKDNCDNSEDVQCSDATESSCLSLNSPPNKSDVLEVAFNLSNELLQDALECFPKDVPVNPLEETSTDEKKLTKSYNGSDYSIETEYLPEMDPLHGGLDISQDSHLIETDADREVVEGASFRKISGQSQIDVHKEMLKHLESVADGYMSKTVEEGDLEPQDEVTSRGECFTKSENVLSIVNQSSLDREVVKQSESISDAYLSEISGDLASKDGIKGQGRLDENVTNKMENVSNTVCSDVAERLNENNNAERNEEENDEKVHKIIHVPSALATSIHESIEGDFEEQDENEDLSDSQYIKKVIHLEKEIDFDSSLGADDLTLSGNTTTTDASFSDKHSTETKVKLDRFEGKGDNYSGSLSKGGNSATTEIKENAVQNKGDNSSKGDNSTSHVKKEVYMTTAGRISIAVDKDGSRTSSGVESNSGGESLSDPVVEESHRQVGSLIQRADQLIARVDEELDVFYPGTESMISFSSQSHPMHSFTSEKSEGGSTSSQVENKDEWQDDELPTMLSEDGKQTVQGSGKTIAERPQSLATSARFKAKKKIVPDISLLEDDNISDDNLRASVDDMETPDDLDIPDDMDENALGELEWENDSPVQTPDDDCEALEEYSEEEERKDARNWKTVRLGDRQFRIDLKVIEPYKKVLSHGGYYGDGLNAIILFSGCYLPDHRRKDYHYVMDNLFYYVVHTLEQLVAEDYMIIYFHGATPKKQMPSFGWMKKCYQMIDRRLRKNLKALLLVHPTIWLKTVVLMTRPFISSKFSAKLRFVRTIDDLRKIVPMEYVYVPDQVQAYDDNLTKRSNLTNASSS